jgi:hypothetical protein
MKRMYQPARALLNSAAQGTRMMLLGFILAVIAAISAYGQGELASGTISGSGSGPYSYSLSFADGAGATAPIGSVWYAWVPGSFYLPGTPAGASAPTGWTAAVDGASVRFSANSSAYYIQPGQSLSGFGYTAAFSPAQLAAAPNSGVSVAYMGTFFSDAGNTFTVSTVPEPSVAMLLIPALGALWLGGRRKLRAA